MSEVHSMDEALDQAINLLTERFGKAEQQAAIQLANILYSVSAREAFEGRRREEPPYAGGQSG